MRDRSLLCRRNHWLTLASWARTACETTGGTSLAKAQRRIPCIAHGAVRNGEHAEAASEPISAWLTAGLREPRTRSADDARQSSNGWMPVTARRAEVRILGLRDPLPAACDAALLGNTGCTGHRCTFTGSRKMRWPSLEPLEPQVAARQ